MLCTLIKNRKMKAKKLILTIAAGLALAATVSAQTTNGKLYTQDQLNRAATHNPEQKAAATRFTEAPAGAAQVSPAPAAATTTVTKANTTTAQKPAVTTTATPAPVHYGPAPKAKLTSKAGAPKSAQVVHPALPKATSKPAPKSGSIN